MRRNRIQSALALMLAIIPVVLLAPQPAQASDVGALAFRGVAELPTFPCAIPNSCTATFNGTASGVLAGEQFGAWTAALTEATVSATNVVYQDTNCVIGTAAGRVTITAGLQQVTGEYKPNNATGISPLPILGITMNTDFTWNRAGANAAIVFANGRVEATIAGMASPMVVATGIVGASTAAFRAHFDAADPPDCDPTNIPPTNTPAVDVDVQGVVVMLDDEVA